MANYLDPNEAMKMRIVSDRFRSALMRGDLPEAKQGMDVMFDRAGAEKKSTKEEREGEAPAEPPFRALTIWLTGGSPSHGSQR